MTGTGGGAGMGKGWQRKEGTRRVDSLRVDGERSGKREGCEGKGEREWTMGRE